MRVNDGQQQALVNAVTEAKQSLRRHDSWRRVVARSKLSDQTWRKLTSPVVGPDGTNAYEVPTLEQAAHELGLFPGALFEVAYSGRRLRDSDFQETGLLDGTRKRAIAGAEAQAGLW